MPWWLTKAESVLIWLRRTPFGTGMRSDIVYLQSTSVISPRSIMSAPVDTPAMKISIEVGVSSVFTAVGSSVFC
jgi:hypothetical protein